MHILTTTSASLDDLAEPVDLRQTPADIVALSFTDSDLAGLAAAWKADAAACRRCGWRRCATCAIRCRSTSGSTASPATPRSSWSASSAATTGGAMAATSLPRSPAPSGIKLALLPGECRDEDLRLIECSTLPREELDALLGYFREGGPDNMTRAGAAAGGAGRAGCGRRAGRGAEGRVLRAGDGRRPALPLAPDISAARGEVAVKRARICSEQKRRALSSDLTRPAGQIPQQGGGNDVAPIIPILFYRSMLLAADVAPIDALVEALRQRGMRPVPIFVSSLKDPTSARLRRNRARRPETRRHHHRHRLRLRRRARRRNPVRPRRRAGVPGHRRHHPPRRLGKQPARPGARRPRHACRACPNSTAASWPARSPSRPRARPIRRSASAPSPTGRSRTASTQVADAHRGLHPPAGRRRAPSASSRS